jgi:chorismate dehydratase
MSVRLGAVSYLNARPLTLALEQGDSPFALSYSAPAVCAAQLEEGRIDVGLIPSIEYARSREPYWLVPGVAIASRGEVLTVRLFYRGALQGVQRVALDNSSRTSAALLRILLRERYGLEPEFCEARPDLEQMLAQADAALLIGDPVLAALEKKGPSLDLGSEWLELTGQPFVFAFWAGRTGALSPLQVRELVRAKERGKEQIGKIALDYAQQRGGSASRYEDYLRRHICFELGEAELGGLRAFYEKACAHGLIPGVPQLRFYPCQDER